jgi:hypothetical protein
MAATTACMNTAYRAARAELDAAITAAAPIAPAAAQGAPPIWYVVSLERCHRLSTVL